MFRREESGLGIAEAQISRSAGDLLLAFKQIHRRLDCLNLVFLISVEFELHQLFGLRLGRRGNKGLQQLY